MWKNSSNTIIIPEEFIVAGSTYKIEKIDSDDNIGGALGDFEGILHRIRIALKTEADGKLIDVPEDELLKTYLHELGHCFNYYYNTETSEEFACAFSNFMYEYLITRK